MRWFDACSLAGILCVVAAGYLVYVPLGLVLTGMSCLTVGIGVSRLVRAKEAMRDD